MKAYQTLNSRTPIFRSCLTEVNLAANRDISGKYSSKLYLGNEYYINRTGKLIQIEQINSQQTNLSEKEQALVILRGLLESPGIFKGYDLVFRGAPAMINLEKHFKSIIYERYPKEIANRIVQMVYTNENQNKFTLSGVQEIFSTLNLKNLDDLININRPKPGDRENSQFVYTENKNSDFTLIHNSNPQLRFPSDYTVEEMPHGEFILTSGPFMRGKNIYDLSNSSFNKLPDKMDIQEIKSLNNYIIEVGPPKQAEHIENLRERYISENNLSLEEKKKIEFIFKEIKNFSNEHFKNTMSISDFRRKSIEFQKQVTINYSDIKIPRPNTCLITSALNPYDDNPEMQPLAQNLYDKNEKITEFYEKADTLASQHIKRILERNQFSDDLYDPIQQRKLNNLWRVLNNSNYGKDTKDQYQGATNDINTEVISRFELNDID